MKILKANSKRVKTRSNTKAAPFPVTPGLLRQITQKVIHAFQPKNIILFGSYAYGKPTADSDLDLLIVMENPDRPAERIRKVSDLFDPRPFPSSFSPLGRCGKDLAASTPSFEEVLERGQTLYGSET